MTASKLGRGEISLEQKENKTYSVTVGLNQRVSVDYFKNIYWIRSAVQAFREGQTFGDDAEMYASINVFLDIYHQIRVEKQMFLERKWQGKHTHKRKIRKFELDIGMVKGSI